MTYRGWFWCTFPTINFYSVRKKGEKILRSRQTRDSLLSHINGKLQPANVKKWRENCDHVVAIAILDSGKRGAKCPC